MEEQSANKRKSTFSAAAEKCIKKDGDKSYCAIDAYSGCTYVQEKYDVGNFIRHFRSQHPLAATKMNLAKETESPVKKLRIVPKQSFAIDRRLMMEVCLKLVTHHHLPFNCFEWEALKLLFDPVMETLNIRINRHNIKIHVTDAARKVREFIKNEMTRKLISLKIDSASRHGRHIIGVNVQYEVDGEVAIRTLGNYKLTHGKNKRR